MNNLDILDNFREKLNANEYASTKHLITTGLSGPLTEEKQRKYYPWFLLGKSFKEISELTDIPIGIIVLTACQYDWWTKKDQAEKDDTSIIEDITKNNMNNLLMLTQLAINNEVADVLTGKKDARDSKYVPQSLNQMKEFMTVVLQVNNVKNLLSVKTPLVQIDNPTNNPPPAQPVNIQINNSNGEPPQITASEEKLKSLPPPLTESEHIALLEAIAVKK